MPVLNLPAFGNKKYTADELFHRNGPYGQNLTEKEPIRTLRITLPHNNRAQYLLTVQYDFSDYLHRLVYIANFGNQFVNVQSFLCVLKHRAECRTTNAALATCVQYSKHYNTHCPKTRTKKEHYLHRVFTIFIRILYP